MISINATPKFSLGQCVATPGAMEAMTKSGDLPHTFLDRHVSGDWGDVGAEDKRANDRDLVDEGRLLSSYKLQDGTKIWVITEADRSSTCILLPEEY